MSAVNQDVTNNKDDDDVSVSQWPPVEEVLGKNDIDTKNSTYYGTPLESILVHVRH